MLRWLVIMSAGLLPATGIAGEITSWGALDGDRILQCRSQLNSSDGGKIDFSLSVRSTEMALNVSVSGYEIAQAQRRFYDDNSGFLDMKKLTDALATLRFGSVSVPSRNVLPFAIQLSELNERAGFLVSVSLPDDIISAVDGMEADRIEIGSLVTYDGTAAALADFRSCALVVLGLTG